MGGAGILPRDAYLEAMLAETLSPSCHALRLGRQKRSIAGHRFGRGAEKSGHAHHRGPADVGRPLENGHIGNDAFDAGYGLEQWHQARLGPHRDAMSKLREMRGAAGEQKMVAKTLLAAENQQFALEALPAPGRPWRGRKVLRNTDVEGDAPFVFRPRFAPASVQQFDQ